MLLFLIPTAKEMLEENPTHQKVILSTTSQKIIQEMSSKTLPQLMQIYHFKKEEVAQKELDRWKHMMSNQNSSYHAIDLFNGLMYRSLKKELEQRAQKFLNTNTFITSALYGIIPINSLIQAHRLDFANKVEVEGQSLKQIWQEHYDHFIKSHCEDTIISLLSTEFENVFSTKFRKKLVQVKFYEESSNGELKGHSTISKKGRGYFLKTLAENQCHTLDDIKQLSFNGYRYQETEDKTTLTYIRKINNKN